MKDRASLTCHWLGTAPYAEAWALQRALVERRLRGDAGDTALFLEHPHVYTLGRRSGRGEALLDDGELARLGVALHHVDRGGQATYHGPGQLVCYPIVDIRGLGGPVRYVRVLEAAVADAAGALGVAACGREGMPGVWTGAPAWRKLAAIGLRVTRGVSSHGFALNVSADLRYFRHIVPCGVPELPMTSLERELGAPVDAAHVRALVAVALGRRLGRDVAWASAEASRALLAGAAPAETPGGRPSCSVQTRC